MPRTPRQVVQSALPALPSLPVRPTLPTALTPLTRRPKVNPAGWTTTELTAYLAAGRTRLVPPRRAGHEAVRLTNLLDGTLPVEAVLLARAVADAAPPLGHEISPTLLQIVERYLPDTLTAYRNSGTASHTSEGHRLILEQLQLLHQVTRDVVRAQAEHDDRELRVQEAFLKERFARTSNGLDLPPRPGLGAGAVAGGLRDDPALPGNVSGQSAGARTSNVARTGPRGLAASTMSTHHRLGVEHSPTAVFNPDSASDGILNVRLALPPMVSVTLGAVYEMHSGAMGFVNSTSKRWQAKRRQRGFGSTQLDVSVQVQLRDVRRFLVHATTRPGGLPVEAVLFLTEGATNTAELPTTITRRAGANTVVIASGHDTRDGLFVRNESLVFPHLQGACDAFDYGRITWLSPDTPAI